VVRLGALHHDLSPIVIPAAYRRPGHSGAEQDLTAGVGRHHAFSAQRRREPVHATFDVALQHGRGERVEIVLCGQQEHRRDPLEPRAAAGRRGEQLARRQLQPGLPDPLPLPLQAAHISTSSPANRSARPRSTTHGSPPTSSGRVRAGRATPSRLATGAAVTPYKVTVATITTNVAGRT